MPTFPSSFPPELDYELNCAHGQEWHCPDSAEEMMTSGSPISASALRKDNVPDPETISFNSKLYETGAIVIPVLQMGEVRLSEVESHS